MVAAFFLVHIRKTWEVSMFVKMLPQKGTILEKPFSSKPGLSQLFLIGKAI